MWRTFFILYVLCQFKKGFLVTLIECYGYFMLALESFRCCGCAVGTLCCCCSGNFVEMLL